MSVSIPIATIDRRPDARQINRPVVDGLVESISVIGLINPVRVRRIDSRWELIAGSHRLAAYERLGIAEIECIVIDDDDLHAELAMIDENLMRAELSASERAVQTARRKAIYLVLHPETAAGVAGALAKHSATADFATAPSFTASTSAATGSAERSVRLDAERGEKVIAEVVGMIAGTKLDSGVYLDKLKRLSPNDQVSAAKRDLSILKSEQRQSATQSRASKIDADVKSRAAREVADIVAEHVPAEWWGAVQSNLYAAGAKNIADALTTSTEKFMMDGRQA